MDRRLTLLLGFGQMIAWALTYYIPAVTTQQVAADLGTTPGAVLGGFSLALIVTGLASPRACRTIDRIGGRSVLLAGTLVQAAGLLVMATAAGLPQWYAGWAVTGLGMAAGLYDAAFSTAGRQLGAAARPTITAITMIGGFASTLGWPLGAILVPQLGWRGLLLAYAVALLAINLPLYALLPRRAPPRPPRAAAARATPAGHGLAFTAMAAFFTLRGGLSTVITVSAPAILVGAGLPFATAIGLIALIGPAQVAMRVLQAAVGQRWSPIRITAIGGAVLPLALLPLILLPGPDTAPGSGIGTTAITAAAAAFVLGYGASNGILTIARGTLPLFLFGPEGYATRIGQIALPVILAQAAAPLVFAPLVGTWSARAVLLVIAAVATLACIPLLALRRP